MANETRYFRTAFAESGNKTEIPDTGVDGNVGYDTGYSPDYELPQGNPSRKRVRREFFNGLHNSITENIKQWQESLYPTWIEDDGTGSAFSYPIGMIVNHNNNNWVSNEDSNQEEPGTGSKWSDYEVISANDLTLIHRFADVAEMLATTIDFPDGKAIYVSSNDSTYTKLSGSTTVDGLFVLRQTALDNSFSFNVQETVYAEKLGIVPGSGQTSEISTFLEYIHDNKLKGVIKAGQYNINEQLLNKTTNGKLILTCQDGVATFNYTGPEVGRLISASDIDAAQLINVTFQCNDLVASPLDLRKTGTPTGNVGLFNVNSFNCKQTTLTVSPSGLFISGAYNKVNVQDCEVDGVSYVDVSRASSGIVVIQAAGIVKISGCIVSNISTPSDQDADGIVVFGTDVNTITTYLGARAEIHNNILSDCEGRFIKLQISDYEVHANTFKLSSNFSTITEWRGIDGQANNGDIHSNTMRFGTGITFGTNANLFTLQNIRNDSGNKTSNVYKNRCTSGTDISMMFNLLSNFGTCIYNLDDNDYIGANVDRIARHTVTTLATTDEMRINIRHNKAAIIGELFDPTNNIDFGDKLYLEILDNENLGNPDIRIYDDGATSFSVGANFRVRNNAGIRHRINWVFDFNNLLPGNSLFTGEQVNLNAPTGVGSNFHHVEADGYWQKAASTTGSSESRRTSTNGSVWNAWTAV